MSISVVILTLNEAVNLPACLRSVDWCDDVVVLDSYSGDGTMDIAERLGARVFQRRFDDFAAQRNWALEHAELKHPWVFHLDADERFTPQLLEACRRAVERDEHSAYLVPSKLMYMGQWLRRSSGYPVYQMRFHKLGEAHFEQVGHGQRETNVTRGIGTLHEPYLHEAFSKGLDDWFERHNRYSRDEAKQALADLDRGGVTLPQLFSKDPVIRRRAIKRLAWRLPGRAALRFVHSYLLKGGFLDGRAGYEYCRLLAIYEQMITRKINELRATSADTIDESRGEPVRPVAPLNEEQA